MSRVLMQQVHISLYRLPSSKILVAFLCCSIAKKEQTTVSQGRDILLIAGIPSTRWQGRKALLSSQRVNPLNPQRPNPIQ